MTFTVLQVISIALAAAFIADAIAKRNQTAISNGEDA
jgi:hypothetical protein